MYLSAYLFCGIRNKLGALDALLPVLHATQAHSSIYLGSRRRQKVLGTWERKRREVNGSNSNLISNYITGRLAEPPFLYSFKMGIEYILCTLMVLQES